MEALKKKLKSRRGASILLALLFLLVCMMVGASVVMAASSNVGKAESNRREQQRYLTLSSALTMLCDELEHVEYVGSYTRYTEEGTVETVDVTIPAGGWREIQYIDKCTYEQKPGKLVIDGDDNHWLNDVLPLAGVLDGLLSKKFKSIGTITNGKSGAYGFDHDARTYNRDYVEYTYSGLDPAPACPDSYTLTFKVDDPGNKYGGLSEPVRIIVELEKEGGEITGKLKLTASLGEMQTVEGGSGDEEWKENYTMSALLKPTDTLNEMLEAPSPVPGTVDPGSGVIKTGISWELEFIKKGELTDETEAEP